ncbi:DsbA family protein [Orbaceae bacterium ESL0727]|nr:DsbA family protein [Orbaceae bacterium ESL0727]
MKKTVIAISTLLFSLNCFTVSADTAKEKTSTSVQTKATMFAPIKEGKQYLELPSLRSPDREVIEFFSFNCPSCFKFETEFHATKIIGDALPAGVKLKRYHLDNFGPLAPELAQAWAIANVLNVQDKATEAFYFAVQKERKIKTADDIKAVFATIGVDGDTFDKTKDNFLVKAFLAQQADALTELKPNSIPAVIVDRKYYINPRGLDESSNENTIKDYARVAAYLAAKTKQPEEPKAPAGMNNATPEVPAEKVHAAPETEPAANKSESEQASQPESKTEPQTDAGHNAPETHSATNGASSEAN